MVGKKVHTRDSGRKKQIGKGLIIFFLSISLATVFACLPEDGDLQEGYINLPNGDKMHYLEIGNPDGKPIVFLHGYPTNGYLYRNVMRELCGSEMSGYRCIAPTLIGLGKSSCPGDGSTVGPLYETDRVEEFIQAMDVTGYALVVHDWGGPIGVVAALRQAGDLSHIIAMNTFLSQTSYTLLEVMMGAVNEINKNSFPLIEAIAPAMLGLSIQALTVAQLDQKTINTYTDPFSAEEDGACKLHASLNLFAREVLEAQLFDELEDYAQTVWSGKPTHFLWATNDPVFGPNTPWGIAVHSKMEDLFPQAGTEMVDNASHFMQEDQPVDIAGKIRKFIEDN